MEQVGYSLIDGGGNELQVWGDTSGQTQLAPDFIDLPNGDRVYCPAVGYDYSGFRLVSRWLDVGPASAAFDGEKITVTRPALVPQSISRRQFYQQLAVQGIITEAEAIASNAAVIPAAILEIIGSLPLDQQFAAKMLVSGASEFQRQHPLTTLIGVARGLTSEQIDAFFIAAAAL